MGPAVHHSPDCGSAVPVLPQPGSAVQADRGCARAGQGALLPPPTAVPALACCRPGASFAPLPNHTLVCVWPSHAAPYVPELTLHHFFDWRWVSFASFRGWMVSVATFANALLAAFYLRLIVSAPGLFEFPSAPECGSSATWLASALPAAPLRTLLPRLPAQRAGSPCWPFCPSYIWLPALPCPDLPFTCVQVQRAKKCLDFAGTLMLLHLIAVTCFSGFPKRLPWCGMREGKWLGRGAACTWRCRHGLCSAAG